MLPTHRLKVRLLTSLVTGEPGGEKGVGGGGAHGAMDRAGRYKPSASAKNSKWGAISIQVPLARE